MNSMRGRTLSALFLIFCFIHISGIRAAEKPRLEETLLETLKKIEIFPSLVFLGGQRNTQQLVVEGYYADGYAEDLTPLVQIYSDDPSIVRVERGIAYPVASGTTTITAKMAGLSSSVKVVAKNI